jgi:ATP-dependent DNA helicase RecQ
MLATDAVLLRITQEHPTTVEELRSIDGITETFVGSYGKRFLQSQKTPSKTVTPARPAKTVTRTSSSSSSQETLRLFKSGRTVEEICSSRGLKPSTIESHLCSEWEIHPEEIDRDKLGITAEVYHKVAEAVSRVGKDRLRPIKDEVGDEVSYLQIKASLLLLT